MPFLEYFYDNWTEDAKGVEERQTKAKAHSQEKLKKTEQNHTKFWLHSAYNKRGLLQIWCWDKSATECSFHTFLFIIRSFYLDLISFNIMLIERFADITIT